MMRLEEEIAWLYDLPDRPYSTELKAAWELVEYLRHRTDGHFTILSFTTGWKATFRTLRGEEYAKWLLTANYETAGQAICMAAIQYARGI